MECFALRRNCLSVALWWIEVVRLVGSECGTLRIDRRELWPVSWLAETWCGSAESSTWFDNVLLRLLPHPWTRMVSEALVSLRHF